MKGFVLPLESLVSSSGDGVRRSQEWAKSCHFTTVLKLPLAMSSDNAQSAVTYTSISSDSDGPSWDPMELDEHVLVYVLEPEHLEYHAPSDEDIQVEDDDEDPEEEPKEDPSEEHEPEDDDEDPEEDPTRSMSLRMRILRSLLRVFMRLNYNTLCFWVIGDVNKVTMYLLYFTRLL
nr:hypothetical protein [Tanacetum cinerariifolium]